MSKKSYTRGQAQLGQLFDIPSYLWPYVNGAKAKQYFSFIHSPAQRVEKILDQMSMNHLLRIQQEYMKNPAY